MKRLFLLCFVVVGCTACHEPAATQPGRSGRRPGPSISRNLTQAVDYLTRANEFDPSEADRQVAFLLNRWLDGQSSTAEWHSDPLMQRLPREIRNTTEMQTLGRMQFQLDDVHALQQAIWMRDLSKWISQRPADAAIEAWIEERAADLGESETSQMLVATRLFDWTIRNIQLDELLPYPSSSFVGPEAGTDPSMRPEGPPPMRGVAGPGYQFQPWQTLLYGHGDSQQRARVFILLCRQQGIDAVTLAFPSQAIPPRPRPWLPAALVAGQLYLFDTQLGLPIPGPGMRGVATLQQAVEDPRLLAALAVGEANPYDIDAADLESTLALMEVAPFDVSRRMEVIEQQMSGEYRVVLTVSPTALAQRLEEVPGVESVAFWRVPMEACWYWNAVQRQLSEDHRASAEYMMRYALFTTRNSLMQGRHLHFRGILENEGDEDGAIKYYLKSRVPQDQIDRLHESEDLQKGFGLVRQRGEHEMVWAAKVATARGMVLQSKEHASYWLGLVQYELARFESAVEWFEQRTLNRTPDGIWAQGARYNLSRSLEAMGKLEEARKQYLSSEGSPQHHGDLIRARMLAKRIAQEKAAR
ncbi:MAG: tol-pal system YbgF family protein [Pirellulaceae bacterium]